MPIHSAPELGLMAGLPVLVLLRLGKLGGRIRYGNGGADLGNGLAQLGIYVVAVQHPGVRLPALRILPRQPEDAVRLAAARFVCGVLRLSRGWVFIWANHPFRPHPFEVLGSALNPLAAARVKQLTGLIRPASEVRHKAQLHIQHVLLRKEGLGRNCRYPLDPGVFESGYLRSWFAFLGLLQRVYCPDKLERANSAAPMLCESNELSSASVLVLRLP